jgi:putative membrane protein insertion efficiency factor
LRAFVRFQTGWATSGERSVFGHDSARRPVRVPCTQRSRVRLRWVVLIVLTLFIVDGLRPPASQLSAIIYLRLVRQYQLYVSPTLSRRIHCRFTPSCSAYSSEAVRRYGIIRGGVLTVRRLIKCNPWQRPNTPDPVT